MGGYFSRKLDPKIELVDLRGKVVIVTGGNAGIGFATVQHLARGGAKVYLAARNEARATGALLRLRAEGFWPGNGEVEWLRLDLSSPRDAKKAAEDFLQREKRLDILVNNAGMLSAPYEKTPDGISTMAAVNYIGPYVFTRTLLPRLTEMAREPGSDVRIVNVTSIAHKLVPSTVCFENVEDFNVTYSRSLFPGFARYAHSKLMNILWTKSLQKRFDAADPPIQITTIAVHPGGVDTFTHKWIFPRVSKWLVGLVIADPVRGAYNSVFAAASRWIAENRQDHKGVYLESHPTGKITKLGKVASDEELAEQLWRTTEKLLDTLGL